MKLFFASIFLAVLSVPFGILSAVFFLTHSVRPDVIASIVFGGTVNGFVLFLSLMLFVVSLATNKAGANG